MKEGWHFFGIIVSGGNDWKFAALWKIEKTVSQMIQTWLQWSFAVSLLYLKEVLSYSAKLGILRYRWIANVACIFRFNISFYWSYRLFCELCSQRNSYIGRYYALTRSSSSPAITAWYDIFHAWNMGPISCFRAGLSAWATDRCCLHP